MSFVTKSHGILIKIFVNRIDGKQT